MKPAVQRLLLGISLLGGLLLRLVRLGERPLWYDEAFSLLLSRQTLPKIVAGTAADTMPPLYYFLLHGWLGLGGGIAWARLLNVLLGMLLLGLAYVWGKQLLNRESGLWLVALMAMSPFLIYHAQELRMYTLLAVTTLGYILLVDRFLRAGSQLRWAAGAGVALLAALALYSHNLAGFTLVVPSLLLALRRRWRDLARLALPQAGALLLFSPWLALVPAQISKIQSAFWTPVPGPTEILQLLITIHTNLPVPDPLLPIALFGTLATLAFAAFGLVRLGLLASATVFRLFAYMLIPAIFLFALSYLMRPLFVPRALIVSALAYFALLALLLANQSDRSLRVLLLASFTMPILLALPYQYGYSKFPRSPFDQAEAYLEGVVGPHTVIVHDNKLSYFPMVVYGPELPMEFLPDEPGSHNDTLALETQDALGLHPAANLEAAVDGANEVWFVVFERAVEEYEAQGRPHPQVAALGNQFQLVDEMRFNDMLLLHFSGS